MKMLGSFPPSLGQLPLPSLLGRGSRRRYPINKAVLGRYATKDNLVHSVGRRVYKDNHPGRQDVNPRGSDGWLSE